MENLSRRGFVGTCCACSSVSFGWEIVRDSPMVNIRAIYTRKNKTRLI